MVNTSAIGGVGCFSSLWCSRFGGKFNLYGKDFWTITNYNREFKWENGPTTTQWQEDINQVCFPPPIEILGIYTTWDSCSTATKHYPGVQFKGFYILADACAYLQTWGHQIDSSNMKTFPYLINSGPSPEIHPQRKTPSSFSSPDPKRLKAGSPSENSGLFVCLFVVFVVG